jgi:hypothetical protein
MGGLSNYSRLGYSLIVSTTAVEDKCAGEHSIKGPENCVLRFFLGVYDYDFKEKTRHFLFRKYRTQRDVVNRGVQD